VSGLDRGARRRGVGSVLVASLVTSACSGGATPGSTSDAGEVEAAVELDCAQAIATRREPDEGTEVILDVVALPTAAAAPTALQTAAWASSDPRVRLWAKSGLVVRGGGRIDGDGHDRLRCAVPRSAGAP